MAGCLPVQFTAWHVPHRARHVPASHVINRMQSASLWPWRCGGQLSAWMTQGAAQPKFLHLRKPPIRTYAVSWLHARSAPRRPVIVERVAPSPDQVATVQDRLWHSVRLAPAISTPPTVRPPLRDLAWFESTQQALCLCMWCGLRRECLSRRTSFCLQQRPSCGRLSGAPFATPSLVGCSPLCGPLPL